jgi:low affinity Fe/Cu permease
VLLNWQLYKWIALTVVMVFLIAALQGWIIVGAIRHFQARVDHAQTEVDETDAWVGDIEQTVMKIEKEHRQLRADMLLLRNRLIRHRHGGTVGAVILEKQAPPPAHPKHWWQW